MKRVETQIEDHQLEKINATGESIYSFLQSAIAEKLERTREERKLDEFKNEMKKVVAREIDVFRNEIEKQLEESLQILVSATKVARDLHEQSLIKDEEFKEKTLENLKKIVGYIKEK